MGVTYLEGYCTLEIGAVSHVNWKYVCSFSFLDDHDMLGRSYLMHAIHVECQEEVIQYILSLNFNINHQAQGKCEVKTMFVRVALMQKQMLISLDGSTALHVSCQHQKIRTTALLLKNKASKTVKRT